MGLRTKLILSICVFMLLVGGLLTLNLLLNEAVRTRAESRRHANLVVQLANDWTRLAGESDLTRQLAESSLVNGWLIAAPSADGSTFAIVTAHPPLKEAGAEEADLREAWKGRRLRVDGSRVYTPIGAPPRYVARLDLRPLGEPEEAAAVGLRGILLIMGVGTLLLVLNAYVFLNRFVMRPMEALVEASRRIAEGDFSKKIPERPTYDEMASLVRAFNLMIERIGKHQAELKDDIRRAQVRITHTERRLFAAQRLSATGTLAAGIAHEINNPLGGMLNAARSLRGAPLSPEKQREYLELIEDGLERIRVIVQKVLQFRPKAYAPQAVAMREVIDRAIAFLDHRARQKRVAVRNELPADMAPVHGDPMELQQAFLNLLMNAVDACVLDEGVVRVTLAGTAGGVSVAIEDNGCGMDAEELARAGDPFFTTKDAGEGTGLGLSVAQTIIQNHGGRLELQSRKGEGTKVTVTLPPQPLTTT